VSELTVVHPAEFEVERLLSECRETRTRRSGPGGQHRNKVETAVVLEHLPSGLRAEAGERRSQAENRAVAVRRLRLRLACGLRVRRAVLEPTPRWQQRARQGRLQVSAEHADYAALVAEAFDHLVYQQADMRVVAAGLGVTPTQLAGLFRKEPAAWEQLNRLRSQYGLLPLK
jgi:hypothetical protein